MRILTPEQNKRSELTVYPPLAKNDLMPDHFFLRGGRVAYTHNANRLIASLGEQAPAAYVLTTNSFNDHAPGEKTVSAHGSRFPDKGEPSTSLSGIFRKYMTTMSTVHNTEAEKRHIACAMGSTRPPLEKLDHKVQKGWYDNTPSCPTANGAVWTHSKSTRKPADARLSPGLKGLLSEMVTLSNTLAAGVCCINIGNGDSDLFRYGQTGCAHDNQEHFDECWGCSCATAAAELTTETGVPVQTGFETHRGLWTLGHNNPDGDGDIYHFKSTVPNIQAVMNPVLHGLKYERMLMGANKYSRGRNLDYVNEIFEIMPHTLVERLANKTLDGKGEKEGGTPVQRSYREGEFKDRFDATARQLEEEQSRTLQKFQVANRRKQDSMEGTQA
jgi:hypothetical protein